MASCFGELATWRVLESARADGLNSSRHLAKFVITVKGRHVVKNSHAKALSRKLKTETERMEDDLLFHCGSFLARGVCAKAWPDTIRWLVPFRDRLNVPPRRLGAI